MKKLILMLAGAVVVLAQPQVPRPAPRINFLEGCRGKVTVVAFIVTTCSHCQAFSKILEELTKTRPVCAVEAAFDPDGNIASFATVLRLTFPVLKVERSVMESVMRVPHGERVGTPQVVVIDRAGMIQAQSAQAGSPFLLQRDVLSSIVDNLLTPKGAKQ